MKEPALKEPNKGLLAAMDYVLRQQVAAAADRDVEHVAIVIRYKDGTHDVIATEMPVETWTQVADVIERRIEHLAKE